MNYRDFISILELLLLAGVLYYLFKFILTNFGSKVQKPKAWLQAAKRGEISAELLRAERKYPDRIRFYNIWLQLNRILKNDVQGDLAELGVYKGDTARIIHLCAPERKLHLLDTFEGFPADDLKNETGKASGYTTRHFADTSVEKVVEKVGGNENVFIHKGCFPASAIDLNDTTFAFVSMDADLHDPTKKGLEFFYPRMEQGGVILVHDYNTDWPGLMKAVDKFAAGIPENLIPVADAESTVMIIKN